MKKIQFIFALILCSISIAVLGQKQLQLKDILTGKVKVFKIGDTFRYKSVGDSDYEKVKIQNITESGIVFYLPDEDEVKPIKEVFLSDIESIQKATTLHNITRIIGGVFIFAGAYTMASSASISDDAGGSTIGYVGLGAGILAVGVIPYLVKPKVYVLGKTHTARIL
jgi:hypothetical protein